MSAWALPIPAPHLPPVALIVRLPDLDSSIRKLPTLLSSPPPIPAPPSPPVAVILPPIILIVPTSPPLPNPTALPPPIPAPYLPPVATIVPALIIISLT